MWPCTFFVGTRLGLQLIAVWRSRFDPSDITQEMLDGAKDGMNNVLTPRGRTKSSSPQRVKHENQPAMAHPIGRAAILELSKPTTMWKCKLAHWGLTLWPKYQKTDTWGLGNNCTNPLPSGAVSDRPSVGGHHQETRDGRGRGAAQQVCASTSVEPLPFQAYEWRDKWRQIHSEGNFNLLSRTQWAANR